VCITLFAQSRQHIMIPGVIWSNPHHQNYCCILGIYRFNVWPTHLDFMTYTEEVDNCWICASVHCNHQLPISGHLKSISTLSPDIKLPHHLKWQSKLEREQLNTSFCRRGILLNGLIFASGSWSTISLHALFWSGKEYSTGLLNCIGSNVNLSHWKVREST